MERTPIQPSVDNIQAIGMRFNSVRGSRRGALRFLVAGAAAASVALNAQPASADCNVPKKLDQTCGEASVRVDGERITTTVDNAGNVVKTETGPAIGVDIQLSFGDQAALMTFKPNPENPQLARAIEMIKDSKTGTYTLGKDTLTFTGCSNANRWVDTCDGPVYSPALAINVGRLVGSTVKPEGQIITAIDCEPTNARYTSRKTNYPEATPVPATRIPATPGPTPEGGSQSPIPSGSQSPISEGQRLSELYPLAAVINPGELGRVQ